MANLTNPKPSSTPLLNRWSERKAIYEACARDGIERKIIDITFSSPMIGFAANDKRAMSAQQELYQDLVKWIGKWRQLLANRANLSISEEQIRQEVDFVIQYFPLLTIADCWWCQECYIMRFLPLDYPEVVAFNADFLSRVLKAYQRFKTEKADRLKKEVERRRQLKKTGTPEQNAEGMRYMLTEVERQLREEASYVYMLREVVVYLRAVGLLPATASLSPEAEAYIKGRQQGLLKYVMAKGELAMKDLLQGAYLSGGDASRLQETLLLEWTMKQFFATHPLDKVLSQVNVDYWTQKEKQANEM